MATSERSGSFYPDPVGFIATGISVMDTLAHNQQSPYAAAAPLAHQLWEDLGHEPPIPAIAPIAQPSLEIRDKFLTHRVRLLSAARSGRAQVVALDPRSNLRFLSYDTGGAFEPSGYLELHDPKSADFKLALLGEMKSHQLLNDGTQRLAVAQYHPEALDTDTLATVASEYLDPDQQVIMTMEGGMHYRDQKAQHQVLGAAAALLRRHGGYLLTDLPIQEGIKPEVDNQLAQDTSAITGTDVAANRFVNFEAARTALEQHGLIVSHRMPYATQGLGKLATSKAHNLSAQDVRAAVAPWKLFQIRLKESAY